MAGALRDKGYTRFFSSRPAGTGSTSREGGLLIAFSSRYVAEHKVLSFTELVIRKAAVLGIGTDLTPINVCGPQVGGVLGRHTNVPHGKQPRWAATSNHRRRHQHLHGWHHQPGH